MTVAVDDQITALMQCLQRQRNHVLGAIEGLSDEPLRRPVLPSGWSCLGMVQHLTLSVERLWFRAVVAGDPEVAPRLGPILLSVIEGPPRPLRPAEIEECIRRIEELSHDPDPR